MMSPGDVIWLYDGTIRPRKRKMCVCLCPEQGLFFRINTKSQWKPCVFISKAEHSFLLHDSHVECNGPLEIDDTSIEESLRVDSILGRLSAGAIKAIVKTVEASKTITPADKAIIIDCLNNI